jgi:hypothetical protein
VKGRSGLGGSAGFDGVALLAASLEELGALCRVTCGGILAGHDWCCEAMVTARDRTCGVASPFPIPSSSHERKHTLGETHCEKRLCVCKVVKRVVVDRKASERIRDGCCGKKVRRTSWGERTNKYRDWNLGNFCFLRTTTETLPMMLLPHPEPTLNVIPTPVIGRSL